MATPAQLWIEALRSGDYQQVQGALQTSDGYCCLGVACEVYIENVGPLAYNSKRSYLPDPVKVWLNLTAPEGPIYTGGFRSDSLAALNDNGDSFEEIANVIESRPTGLFLEG